MWITKFESGNFCRHGLKIKTELNDKTSLMTYMVMRCCGFPSSELVTRVGVPERKVMVRLPSAAKWASAKYFSVQPDPIQSASILSNHHYWVRMGSSIPDWFISICLALHRSACNLIIVLYTREGKCPIPTWILDFRLLLIISYIVMYL